MAAAKTKQDLPDDFEEHILDTDIKQEMESSFLEYAYSVIYSRALPDARDGLKPVQRRILYTMNDMGLRPDRGHVKSARVVGEVMGRLHPHGDGAIYDAMVRMAQPWSMRLPFVDGHGNFGSPDDSPAAMRYTESRMAPAAVAMTASIDEDTVDFKPNYDSRELEPAVLPAAIPNLVVNGTTGIAVGMATNCAPHNLVEVVQALRHLITHPKAGVDDLMRFIPGPDLPTGGKIVGLEGIRDAYETGRGSFRMRATARVESVTNRRKGIVVTELPYGVGTEKVIERIKTLVQGKKLQGISDIKDLTDREHGLRLVIEVKNGFVPEALLEQLYKQTPMEDSFGINAVALVDGQPRTLALKEMLEVFLEHRFDVVRRRSLFRRAQGRRPAAPGRRAADRDPRHRRGHPADPHLRQRRRRQGAADVGVRPERDPGRLHPRHAAAPADEVLPDRAGEGEVRARADHRGARRDPRRRRSCCARSSPTSSPRSPRPSAPRAARCCWSRPAPRSPRPPSPLEVADDPCFVYLSSTGLLARTANAEPPGQGGGRANHDVVVSAVRATARGEVGGLTSAGRLVKIGVLELPQLPDTANDPHLAGGLPVSEILSLEPGERLLGAVHARHRRPRPRARHPPGHRQAGQPRGPRPRRLGGDPARRRRRGRRRGRADHRPRDPLLRHLRRPAAALRRRRRSARRAAPAAASPASGSPRASGSSGSARSTRTPPRARSWSPSSGSSTALPGTEPGAVKVDAVLGVPRQGPRHRRRALPPLPQGRGHPGLRLGRHGAGPGRRGQRRARSTCPRRPAGGTAPGVPGSQPIAACAGPVAARRRCGRLTPVLYSQPRGLRPGRRRPHRPVPHRLQRRRVRRRQRRGTRGGARRRRRRPSTRPAASA